MADEPITLSAPPAAPAPDPRELAAIIQQQRDELARVQHRETEARISSTLSSAVAQHAARLVPGTAPQIEALLRPQIRLAESGSESVVCGPAFESVSDFVKARIDSPEFSHFVTARNPGGGTGGIGSQIAPQGAPGRQPAAQEPTAEPGSVARHFAWGATPMTLGGHPNLGALMVAEGKAVRASRGPAGDPAMDPSQPYGLTTAPK